MANNRLVLAFNPIRVPLSAARKNEAALAAIELEIAKFAADLRKDFRKTVEGWEDKPTFHVKPIRLGNRLTYEVYTNNKKYVWINNGTKKHPIRPRNYRALHLTGYDASSTRTSVIVVRARGQVAAPKSFTDVRKVKVRRAYVRNQSIRARRYDRDIIRRRKPTFSPRMHAAITRALKGL